MSYKLSESFLTPYKTKQPNWGPLGYVTYVRTYARNVPGEDRKEFWWETCRRVIEGNMALEPSPSFNTPEEYIEHEKARVAEMELAYEHMFHFRWLPPGRGLWVSGTEYAKDVGCALVNCWYVPTRPWEGNIAQPFEFMFDESMKGGGVGFGGSYASNAGKIPRVKNSVNLHLVCDPSHPDVVKRGRKFYLGKDKYEVEVNPHYPKTQGAVTYRVDDSREGWVRALQLTINTHWNKISNLVIDVSDVRESGKPIKRFGGTASGPAPLIWLLNRVNSLLNDRVRRKLSTTDVVDIMNFIGACVVAGNVRRCLPEGTLVHTLEGLIPIQNVTPGMLAKTSSGYAPIAELVDQGVQSVWAVDTQLGEFKATARHKMAVLNGIGTYEWKRLNELSPGDRLVFVQEDTRGVKTTLPTWNYVGGPKSTTCKDITIPELDDSMGWLMGLIQGDGYVYANRSADGFNAYVSIACNADHSDIISHAQDQLSRFGTHVTSVERKNERCVVVRTQSKQLAWYLDENLKQPKQTLRTPTWILQAEAGVRAAYVAGVFDADGSQQRPLCVASSIYPEFLRDLQAVLASLGIPSRVRLHRAGKGSWKALYYLNVVGEAAVTRWNEKIAPHSRKYTTFTERRRSQNDYGYPSSWVVDADIDYKRSWSPTSTQMTTATLERCGIETQTLVPVEVLGVRRDVEVVQTYDISVPGDEEFVAQEGLLVHNTAQVALGDGDDLEFVNMKQDLEALKDRRWASNNSLVLTSIDDINTVDWDVVGQSVVVNGEPGFFNQYNSRQYGRLLDGNDTPADPRIEGTNPCGEVSLEPYEPCNLVEVFPFICNRDGVDVSEVLRIATRYSKRVTLGNYEWPESLEVVQRNRRIGVSLSGVQDWLAGIDLAAAKVKLDEWYKAVRAADEEISSDLSINTSIKVTTVKPSGTISKLVGTSEGMHWHYAKYMIRRIRFQESDPIVQELKALGFVVEVDVYSQNTVVVEFPIKAPSADLPGFRSVDEVSAREQLEMQLLLQTYWSDQAVSATITFKPEEADQVGDLLREFAPKLKSTSMLPYSGHGYEQAPIEPIDEDTYNQRVALLWGWPSESTREAIDFDLLNDECATGACPIR